MSCVWPDRDQGDTGENPPDLSQPGKSKNRQNKNYQILLTGVYNSYSPELTYFYGEGNIANYKNDEVSRILSDTKNITDQKILGEK